MLKITVCSDGDLVRGRDQDPKGNREERVYDVQNDQVNITVI